MRGEVYHPKRVYHGFLGILVGSLGLYRIHIGQKPMMTAAFGAGACEDSTVGATLNGAFRTAWAGSISRSHFRALSRDISMASMWSYSTFSM